MLCSTLLTLQPNALRRSALIQGKTVAHSLNYYRFSSRNQQHRREGVSDKERRFFTTGAYAEQEQYKHASEHFFSALLHSRHLTILSIVCPPPAQNHLKTSRPEVLCSPAPADFLSMQGSRRRQYSVLSRRMTPQRLKSAAPDRVCIVPVRHPVRDQEKSRFDTVSRALYAVPHLVKRYNQQHCVEVP